MKRRTFQISIPLVGFLMTDLASVRQLEVNVMRETIVISERISGDPNSAITIDAAPDSHIAAKVGFQGDSGASVTLDFPKEVTFEGGPGCDRVRFQLSSSTPGNMMTLDPGGKGDVGFGGSIVAIPAGIPGTGSQPCTANWMVTATPNNDSSNALSVRLRVTFRIISGLSIVATEALRFPRAVSGDGASRITPEGPGAAQIRIRGEPYASYRIVPVIGPQYMTLSTNQQDRISVSDITMVTNPRGGVFGADGTANIYIGGTRAALPVSQRPGNYKGMIIVVIGYPF